MKKIVLITFVAIVALSMMPEESQAVWFWPDDCVENGTPQQNMNCLWQLQIAIMHDEGFQGLYGMTTPVVDPQETEIITPKNTLTEPVYVVNTKSVTWYPLRA